MLERREAGLTARLFRQAPHGYKALTDGVRALYPSGWKDGDDGNKKKETSEVNGPTGN